MSATPAVRPSVCLLAPGLYAWGSHDPAGRAARTLGRELVKRGVKVSAVIPRRRGQRDLEQVDGMAVHSYPPASPWSAFALCRRCDADVYHLYDASLFDAAAAIAQRGKRRLVTIGAPHRWMREFLSGDRLRTAAAFVLRENPVVWFAARSSDALLCASDDLLPIARARYRVRDPIFLPTPVVIPRRVQKGSGATVCFLGAWEKSARPRRFFDLVGRYPSVRFIAAGKARDRAFDAALRRDYGALPNLEFTGQVDPFHSDTLANVLAESWILVSTGSHRGVPDECVQAAAHRCAILSDADPDGIATRFGHHAADGDLAAGLDALLADEHWRRFAELGHQWVSANYDAERVVEQYLALCAAHDSGESRHPDEPRHPRESGDPFSTE